MSGPRTTVVAFRAAGRNGSVRRVLLAFFLFNAEEYAVWIAVLIYAYQQGGTTAAGALAIAQLVPAALLAPLGATLGDRIRRDRALGIGYAAQAVATALLAAALWSGPPLLVYAVAIVAACAITLTRPVHNAIVPMLADTPQELTAANSLSGTVEGLGVMIGPALSSLLIAAAGPGAAVAACAVLAALAGALTLRLRLDGAGPNHGDDGRPEGPLRAAAEGFRELRREPGATLLATLGGAQYFVLGVLDVFYAALAVEVLHRGEDAAALLASAAGIGGLLGASATVLLVGRRRLTPAVEGGLVVMGLGLAAVPVWPTFASTFALIVVAGAGRSFFDVAARTLLQRSVKDEAIARVFGLQEGLIMLSLAAGSVTAPLMAAVLGIRWAFVACGLLLPLGGLASVATLRAIDRRSAVPDEARLRLLRAISIFALLPEYELEQIAWQLLPASARAGEVIIREGDPGDRFYVLVEGEAVVESKGREVVRRGRGDYFGEIALLRDVPRTATVRALSDVELFALDREHFLAAATGSWSGTGAANEEIDRRLSELADEAPGPPQNRNNPG